MTTLGMQKTNGVFTWGNWAHGGTGYVGVEFNLGNGMQYGWAELTAAPDLTNVTLDAWGYETQPGVGITAGETGGNSGTVPEPSSAALLAMGVAGLALYRRRRAGRK
jgi:hypothetical protein